MFHGVLEGKKDNLSPFSRRSAQKQKQIVGAVLTSAYSCCRQESRSA